MKTILTIILVICIFCFAECSIKVPHNRTTDISEYSKYDNCVGESETNFFPELDENIMSNFKYSYNVDCFIDCAHEIYLEFNIENEDEFAAFISEHQNKILQENEDVIVQQFMYDEAYTEVVIEDIIRSRYTDDDELVIDYAYVRKLIYNEENNSVIFIYLYVEDYWEFENSTYIERFNIDPNGLLPQ
jgi:hypothetical protein